MPLSDSTKRDSRLPARQLEYEDTTVFVIDTASIPGSTDVDIVDGTALVIVDTPEGPEQHEFELPDGDATAFNNNGVVTIEVNQ